MPQERMLAHMLPLSTDLLMEIDTSVTMTATTCATATMIWRLGAFVEHAR